MVKVDGLLRHGEQFYIKDNKSLNRYLVLKHTLENYSVNDIAAMLDISRKTVFYHFQGLKKEFDLGNISTAGKYNKANFKRALLSQGFSLDLFFDYTRPEPLIEELPMGVQHG